MRTSGRRFQAEETAGMKVLRQELLGMSKEQEGGPHGWNRVSKGAEKSQVTRGKIT